MSHFLTFESGWGLRVTCESEPGADCRLAGADGCECESWNIKRDADGTPYHEVQDYASVPAVRHEMRQVDYCNVVEFIDDAGIDDSYVGKSAKVLITPEWQHDHYGWSLA